MRTKIIFTLCIIIGTFPVFAQESSKLRTGVDIGYAFPPNGIVGAIELKYNLHHNMNVGFKAENTFYRECDCNSGKILSFSTTYDYYFHSTGRRSSPFIGAGLGYYFCKAWDNHFIEEEFNYSVYNNPTCFIRAGFEIRKFRMSLAYNLIRKPSEINPSNRNRDYISINIGFYLGGRKWK